MDDQAPSHEEWLALYQAANDFKQLAPWEWMYDSDLFGVQNPETDEIGYCCVMGNLGEHFALGVYLGTEGLEGYEKIAAGQFEQPNISVLHYQKCLMASFEDREYIEKEDRDVIKQLGLKYRGRAAWPQFRSYEPDLFPWFLTAGQARFLTTALQQAIDVAKQYENDPTLLDPPEEGLYLVRVPVQSAAGLIWNDKWLAPKELPARPRAIPEIDEPRLQRIKKSIKVRQGVWEGDFFLAPTPIQEVKGERPYYPYTMMWVDRSSRMVFPPEIASPSQYRAAWPNHFLSVIEQAQGMPREIHVSQQETYDLIEPIASSLSIKLKRNQRLSALEDVRDSLMSFFT
jgi:hypothetical protein